MGNKLNATITYILSHQSEGPSKLQIAEACGVSTATVDNARRILKSRGEGIENPHSPHETPPSPSTLSDLPEINLLDLPEIADASERMQILTAQMRQKGVHPQTRIQAAAAIRAEETASLSSDQLGPRPPLSPDDKIDRLSRLISACGPELTLLAWRKAFPNDSRTQETASQTESV